MQVTSVPSRNEPDGENPNVPFLFGELDRVGPWGFAGCENRPRGKSGEGLGWFAPDRSAGRRP